MPSHSKFPQNFQFLGTKISIFQKSFLKITKKSVLIPFQFPKKSKKKKSAVILLSLLSLSHFSRSPSATGELSAMPSMCPLLPSLPGPSPFQTRPFHRTFCPIGLALGQKAHDRPECSTVLIESTRHH